VISKGTAKSRFWESRNPSTDRYLILHTGCCPGRSYVCQFWWRSAKGFRCGVPKF